MSSATMPGELTAPPSLYRKLESGSLPRGVTGVAREDAVSAVTMAVTQAGTLHRWAAAQPGGRALQGRGVAWAVRLPDGTPVVVRHNRHGGIFARATGDRFLSPTRAPDELDTALRLAASGVPTPEVVAFVIYPAGPLLRRVDVATREIANSADLPAALERWPTHRATIIGATARLISQLARAGAHHPDLNVKNILLNIDGDNSLAHVLDVDRVIFGAADDPSITESNLSRLERSVRRWHQRRGPLLDTGELQRLQRLAREGA